MKKLLATLCLSTLGFASQSQAQTSTLTNIKNRGVVHCGVGTGLAGFALADATGRWTGLDVDLCRAISAAIFNDPEKVKFIPLTTKDRFTALQSGEIDVLARVTTWTMSRDTSLGLLFTGANYYDGQAFIVKKSLGVDSALKLNGASICIQQGTTTELNMSDYARANNIKYEPVTFEKNDETIKAFEAGRCDALTGEATGLYSLKGKLVNPEESTILPDIISKEPLGPVVRSADSQWFNIVKWVHFAMLNAEELNVKQAEVEKMATSANPDVRRLLGVEGKFGEGLGLTADWAFRIVKHVGNYGEAFERNLGSGSTLKVARGQNALWNKGGLQYAPPIR